MISSLPCFRLYPPQLLLSIYTPVPTLVLSSKQGDSVIPLPPDISLPEAHSCSCSPVPQPPTSQTDRQSQVGILVCL